MTFKLNIIQKMFHKPSKSYEVSPWA